MMYRTLGQKIVMEEEMTANDSRVSNAEVRRMIRNGI